MTGRNDSAVMAQHPEQALVVRRDARVRLHDGLVGEYETTILQCRDDLVGDPHQLEARALTLFRPVINGKAVATGVEKSVISFPVALSTTRVGAATSR